MNWIDDIQPEYGTVTGQYIAISYDSSDADLTPDVQPLNGTITIAPTVTAGQIDTTLAQILALKVRVFGGQIVDDEDQPGVRILSTDTNLGIQDWAWTARFEFDSGLKLKPLPFKVGTGETVSLTSGIVPVESAPYQIVKGEPGRGITSVSGSAGGLIVVTYDDGTTNQFTIDGYVLEGDTRLSDARTPKAHKHPWSDLTDVPSLVTDTEVNQLLAEYVKREPTDITTENLNTVINDGRYVQISSVTATSTLNYPTASAGLLEVVSRPGDYLVWQRYITWNGTETYWRARYGGTWYGWQRAYRASEATTALAGKSNTGHTHSIDSVTGLHSALTNAGASAQWDSVADKPDTFPATPHEHPQSSVTGLVAALAGASWVKPQLAVNTDLNTLQAPGLYPFTASVSTTLLNLPSGSSSGTVEVYAATAVTQRVATYGGTGPESRIWIRRMASGDGTWGPWLSVATVQETQALLAAKRPVATIPLTTGQDLNTVTVNGTYLYSKSNNHPNSPVDAGSGVLEVMSTDTTTMQRISIYGGSGTDSRVWVRRIASVATGAWSPWRQLATTDQLAVKADIEAVELAAGINLNDFVAPGTFYESLTGDAQAGANFPQPIAGVLLVTANASRNHVHQQYITAGANPRYYIRGRYAGAWSAWKQYVVDDDPRLSDARAPLPHTHELAELTGVAAELDARLDMALDGMASGYDVAVQNGFVGTEAEWLASLEGDQGPEGPYGGTAVTDPQVASFVTSQTDTRAALDRAYLQSVSVAESGAVGDGVADDAAAIQAALDKAATFGISTRIPAGTYRLLSPLTLPAGVDLRMDADTVLDFSDHAGTTHMLTGGTIDPTRVPVTGGAVKGALALTVDPTGIAAEQWIRVASSDLYDPGNTNISLGELVQVREVTAEGVTLWTPLCDTYTTSPTVQAVSMIQSVKITGGTVRGDFTPETGRTGLHATLVQKLRIRDTRFEGIDNRHIAIDSCVDAWVDESDFYWAYTTATAYAVSFLNMTRDSGCRASRFRYVRHSLSTNNIPAGDLVGVVRRVEFSGNTVEASSRAIGGSMGGGDAIDTHGAAEDISILHNIVNGSTGLGINVECRSARVIGNLIIDPATGGIAVANQTGQDGEYIVTGNVVRGAGDNWYAISVRPGARGTSSKHHGIVVADNIVKDSHHGITVGTAGTINPDESVTVTGNAVHDCYGTGIYIVSVGTLTEFGNTITGAGNGLTIRDVTVASIGPSSVRLRDGVAGNALYLDGVTYSRIQPGGLSAPAGTGLRISSTCQHLTIGATAHIKAVAPVVNGGDSTVLLAA